MVFTRKFSQFVPGALDEEVGLGAGINTRGEVNPDGGGGDIVHIITQDTSGLAVGRWVRFDNATGEYVHGIATTAEFAEIEGVVLNIISPTQFTLKQAGYIAPGTPGFNGFFTNGVYFLSDSLLGMQTLTVPTTNGYVNKPLFAADGPDSGWVICLMRGVIIGSPGPIPPANPSGNDSNIHEVNQPGNTFAIGDWVRVSGNNVYALADGTNLANSQGVGVVIIPGDPNFTIQFSGWNENTVVTAYDALGIPIPIVSSTVYYISNVVPGQITPNPPTAIGTSVKPAFISASSTDGTGWVLPQRPIENSTNNINPAIQIVNQPGHGFLQGQVVRISAADTYALAQANNAINALPVGFVREVIDVNTFVLQTSGFCDQFIPPFAPLNPTQRYFLSATIPGAITTIEPIGTNYSVPMLIALNATTGYILEQRPLRIITPLANGGTETALVNPGVDSLFAWDGAGNFAEFLGIGPGLQIVGNQLTAPGGAGAGWTIINTTVVGAPAAFVNILNMTGFYRYMIILENVIPDTDNVSAFLRTSSNNGVSFDSGAADYVSSTLSNDGAAAAVRFIAASIVLCSSTDLGGTAGVRTLAALGGISGFIETINPANINYYKQFELRTYHLLGGAPTYPYYGNQMIAFRGSTAIVNALQFRFSVGNVASGTIKLLGTNS